MPPITFSDFGNLLIVLGFLIAIADNGVAHPMRSLLKCLFAIGAAIILIPSLFFIRIVREICGEQVSDYVLRLDVLHGDFMGAQAFRIFFINGRDFENLGWIIFQIVLAISLLLVMNSRHNALKVSKPKGA